MLCFSALFTATTGGGTFSASSVISFSNVKNVHGITNLSSLQNSGQFTVEQEGHYLISCFVNIRTANVKFDIKHNSNTIGTATKHGDTDSYETHAATVTAHLNVGDTIKVIARSNMYIDSFPDSMFTVVQII